MKINFLEALAIYDDYVKHLNALADNVNLRRLIHDVDFTSTDNALLTLEEMLRSCADEIEIELVNKIHETVISPEEAANYGLERFVKA